MAGPVRGEGEALRVRELTARVREILEGAFSDVWVVGEIGGLTRARSGHVYLTLKDEEASLSCVIWRGAAARQRHEVEEGMEVLARGRIVVYPPRGRYQLDIRLIEPRGIGALQIAFEKLKERLGKEGLFDEAEKRPLPFLPEHIGIVTSPTGAAIRDILKVLGRRLPGVPVTLYPARVQGEEAAEEIAAGIEGLLGRAGIDVLIVGRGGGSLEDLWAFNEEVVARAIARSDVPVVSAVGHEVDWTIADLVADVRAPTPSAAAEIVVPSEVELGATLRGLEDRLARGFRGEMDRRRARLESLIQSHGLRGLPGRLLERAQRLDEIQRRLVAGVGTVHSRCRERLGDLTARAESLSPLGVLSRGYTVTVPEGGGPPLVTAAALAPGVRIRTRFARGEAISRVEEVGGGGHD